MTNSVITFNNITKKVVYENQHQRPESAYEEYLNNIRITKKFIKKGEEITIARLRDGHIMTFETIRG